MHKIIKTVLRSSSSSILCFIGNRERARLQSRAGNGSERELNRKDDEKLNKNIQ